jgi:hypothetical protein
MACNRDVLYLFTLPFMQRIREAKMSSVKWHDVHTEVHKNLLLFVHHITTPVLFVAQVNCDPATRYSVAVGLEQDMCKF